jgi:phage-related minor tail protein
MADFPEVGLKAIVETSDFEKGGQAVTKVAGEMSQALQGTEKSSMGSAVAFGAVAGAAEAAVSGGISLLVGVLSSVADNLVNAATAGFRFAMELDAGMDKVAARTGETGAALDAFRQSAEAVYELGMGASFADAANAMAQVHQVTGQTGEALQGLTADALTLQEAFGTGIRQSVRAVNTEMETFGITGQQAFDLITVMMQQTGDPAGDLAMTVAKFGPSFADAGFSAEQMAFVLTQGLQAGAVNARMVADTVQELFATLKGGSEKTQEALNQLFATPGDAATVFKQKVSDLNQTIADQQVALDDTKRALDSAQGAWGDSKQVVNDLRQALSDAQSQLEDMSRPNLAGMDAYNDRIFNLEQQSKEARLAMLQFGEDTPEFAAAKQRLEGINTELEKARLAKEIEFAPQLRALEQAAAAGTEQIVTFDQAMAEVAAKKTEIAGLTAKLQDAEVASAANAEKVKLLSAKYNDLQGSLSLNKDKLTILKDEFANASTPAKEFIDNLATGAMTGPEAMSKIIEGLAKVEDPIERNKLGVALFGGAWKNLGEDVISAMDPTLGTLANVEGATERARGALTGGLDDSWEKFTRTLQMSLGEGFLPILNMLGEKLGPSLQSFADWLKGPGQQVLSAFTDILSDKLGKALADLGPWIESTLIPALTAFSQWFISEGIPAIADFAKWVKDNLLPFIRDLWKLFGQAKGTSKGVQDAFTKIAKAIEPIALVWGPRIIDLWGDIQKATARIWPYVQKIIDRVMQVIRIVVLVTLQTIEKFWDAHGEAIMKIVKVAFDTIWKVIDTAINNIMDLITLALQIITGDWEGAWATVQRIAERTWDTIKTVINAAISNIKTVIESVLGQIKAIISDKWDEFKKKISDSLDAIATAISTKWEEFKTAIGSALRDIGTAISTKWGEFKTAIEGKLKEISTAISTKWEEFKTTISTKLNEIATAISTKWEEFKTTIATKLSDIGTSITTKWAEFKTTIATKLEEIKTSITTKWEEFKTAISSKLNEIGITISTKWAEFVTTINDKLAEIKTAVVTKFQEIYDAVKTKLTSLADIPNQISSTLIGIGTAIVQKILDGVNAFTTFASRVIAKIWAGVTDLYNDIVNSGGTLYTSLRNTGKEFMGAIASGLEAVGNFASRIITYVKNKLVEIVGDLGRQGSAIYEAAKDVGEKIIDDFCTGISSKMGALWNAISQVLNDALEAIGLPRLFDEPNASARSLGARLTAGIAAGVYGGRADVAAAMVNVVNSAIASARRAAGVASPSKVFAKLGMNLMAGLEQGVLSQIPQMNLLVQHAITPNLAAVTAPIAAPAYAGSVGGPTYVSNTFQVGGNTIASGMDEAVFEARVLKIIRSNL